MTTKDVTRAGKEVNLAKVVTPKFLTLTGMPANQTAFKVVRKDGEVMNMPHVSRRRVQRNDALVSVTFEEGLDEAGVTAVMNEWGFTTFTIETSGDRLKAVLRSDADLNTMSVTIAGRQCEVLKPISNSTSDTKKGVAVARMDFAKDAFPTLHEVEEWLVRNDIDPTTVKFTTSDVVTSVQRHDVKDDESHVITVESGVDFRVIRADVVDIPAKFVTVISDTAFGHWGWGQLDFSAYLADQEFTEASRSALYALREVLDQIQFYSDVPLQIRKDLIRNACSQYADHVVALMDALPSKVVVAIRSSHQKENPVSKAQPNASDAQRTDAAKDNKQPAAVDASRTDDSAAPTDAAPEADKTTPVTRGDVEAMIAASTAALPNIVAAAVTQAFAAQRGDGKAPEATPTPAATDAQRSDAPAEPTLADVMRSVTALAEQVTGIKANVDAIEGGTVVRNDGGEPRQVTTGEKDVFRGVFGKRANA